MSDAIQQQVDDLRKKESIISINYKDSHTLQLTYQPSKTHSPYASLSLRIQITLPRNYPQSPPSVRFVDKIYHLNVDLKTGNVLMTILKDDWSSYLSLSTVIQCLDALLEEPDPGNAASLNIRTLFLNSPQKYLKNVQQNVQTLVRQGKKQQTSNYSKILDEEIQQIMQFQPVKVHQQIENVSIIDIPKLSKEMTLSPDKGLKVMRQLSSGSNDLSNEQSTINLSQLVEKQNKEEQRERQRQRSKYIFKNTSSTILEGNHHPSNQRLQTTLERLTQTLTILLKESETLEQTLKTTSSHKLRQLIQKRLEISMVSISEVMEMGEKVKQQLIQTLRTEVKRVVR